MLTPDTPLRDLRKVILYFQEQGIIGSPIAHLVHKDYVQDLVEASVKLHYSPGRNPHNGEKTSRLYYIECNQLLPDTVPWWGVPDLTSEGPVAIATERGFDKHSEWRVWTSPEWEAESERLNNLD